MIRRGRQRRRRLLGGTASLVALVLVAGALGTGRLVSRQTRSPRPDHLPGNHLGHPDPGGRHKGREARRPGPPRASRIPRPKDRLKLLQASQLSQTIRGKGELAVVGGKTAWMPERVVAYNQAGREIAECWATTSEGNVCDRPADAPKPP